MINTNINVTVATPNIVAAAGGLTLRTQVASPIVLALPGGGSLRVQGGAPSVVSVKTGIPVASPQVSQVEVGTNPSPILGLPIFLLRDDGGAAQGDYTPVIRMLP
jgi:hypothetical protein